MTSDNSTKLVIKNIDLACSASSSNSWVLGISKSHPGQKYYFNTETGVSLWHSSIEEMERYLQNMRSIGNQYKFVNCPEPKDPPPNRRVLTKHCNHSQINNGTLRNPTGSMSDISACPSNKSTYYFRPCPYPECTSPVNNKALESNIQSSIPANKDIMSHKRSNCNSNHITGRTCINKADSDKTVQDTGSHEQIHNQTCNENNWLDSTLPSILDVSTLKILAKSGTVEDKWYIIADVSVYLDEIQLLKTLLNSDHQCCLMIPHKIKVELENATKTELRTKAYCANYFIYKLKDAGVAIFDEDDLLSNQYKSDKEHIVNCCMKLVNQNYYVVLITNDLEFKKYRHEINIPVFTVKELKGYLCKNDFNITTLPDQSVVPSHSKSGKASAPNKIVLSVTTSADKHKTARAKLDIALTKDQCIQTSLGPNGSKNVAETQTELSLTQLIDMETVYKNKVQIDDSPKRKDSLANCCQSCGQSLFSSPNEVPKKHIKLKRNKPLHLSNLTDTANINETQSQSNVINGQADHENSNKNENNCGIATSSQSLSQSKNYENVNKNSPVKLLSNDHNIAKVHSKISSKSISMLPDKNTNNSAIIENNNTDEISKERTIEFKEKDTQIARSNEDSENFEYKNVMFEVTSALMEENLRTKCDEWVSRFVQIMEEALTQVIRKNSSSNLLPPLNMYEATMCIGKKYKNDPDVTDASKKLLYVLDCISNTKGNSNININPTKYMEMYSFGVYLIDALQGILSSCEDLQVAAELLSKLLSDIQQPELDQSFINTFYDMPQEGQVFNTGEYVNSDNFEMQIDSESTTNTMRTEVIQNLPFNIAEPQNNSMATNNNKRTVSVSSRNENSENLRIHVEEIHKNNPTEQVDTKKSKAGSSKVSPVKGPFSTSEKTLSSSKNSSVSSPSPYSLRSSLYKKTQDAQERENLYIELNEKGCRKSLFLSNLLLQKSKDSENNVSNCDSGEVSNDVHLSVNNEENSSKVNKTLEPNIVCKFVACEEFENRLRNMQIENEFDEYDYEDEHMALDYLDDDEGSSDKRKLDIDEFATFDNSSQFQRIQVNESNKEDVKIKINFKCFIKSIAQEIKYISAIVYTFSKSYCEQLSSTSNYEKNDILEKAEQVNLYIDGLCTALTSILQRDIDFNYKLQAIFKKTEFGECYVGEDEMEVYGAFIESCLNQVCDLRNIMNNILSSK